MGEDLTRCSVGSNPICGAKYLFLDTYIFLVFRKLGGSVCGDRQVYKLLLT